MLDKDSSGIAVVVRDIGLRKRLQESWSEQVFESYLLLQGEIPEDGEFSARRKPDEKYSAKKFPFRRMRSGGRFAILKVQAGTQDIPNILPGLRHHNCMVCGLGPDAPRPIGPPRCPPFQVVLTDAQLDAMWEVKNPHAQGVLAGGKMRNAPTFRGASTLTKSVPVSADTLNQIVAAFS